MGKSELLLSLSLLGLVTAHPVQAVESALTRQLQQVQQAQSTNSSGAVRETSGGVSGAVIRETAPPRLQELEQPATTVEEWLAQLIVQVTGVQLNSADDGLEIILETSGNLAPVTPTVVGNALIADIPDAVLALPDADDYQAANPAAGIALVSVTNLPNNRVRVAITGTEAPPTAAIRTDAEAFVLSVTPGTATADTADDAIQVIVTGEQEEGYNPSEATTGTRIEAPLRDLPLAIQVIPEQVIEDQRVVRFNELANTVPGVEPQIGYGGISSTGFLIRGFSTEFESFRDGFRDFGFISPRDVANVERVEFLRGPASVLYGGGFSFSGAVNTVTKRPLPEPRYQVEGIVGSYDFYRSTLDFTGPLNDNATVLYRLNVAYENADSFRDFNRSESIFVAPVISWDSNTGTRLTVGLEYQDYKYAYDRGLPPIEASFDVPISRTIIEPDFNDAEFDSVRLFYDFEHEFSDQWRIRNGLNVLSVQGGIEEVSLGNFDTILEPDGRTLTRSSNRTDESQFNIAMQTELIGEFQTGSIEHNLLFGVELARYRFAYNFFSAPIGPIDFFDPDYGAEPGEFEPNFNEEYGSDNVGIYLQDLIYLTPNLILLAGGRFDWSDTIYRDRNTNTINNEQSETNFAPRLGLVYQPTDTTSLYFNWSNSFNPEVFSRSRTGEAFEPQRGEQFEVGIKQDITDDLSATLALYHLSRQNVLTTDPEDANFSVQTGEQVSRGVEFDITGEILPGWNIIASYAYTDAFVSEDNSIPEDDRLVGVPRNSASLWTTYEIQSGSLEGLGFGLGLVYVDEREALLPNTGLTLPSYFRTDASIFYRRDRYRFAINIKNLFDTEYYNSQGYFIVPGAPLTILGSVAVEF